MPAFANFIFELFATLTPFVKSVTPNFIPYAVFITAADCNVVS